MEATTRSGAAERIEAALDLVRRRIAPDRRAATERFVREYFRQASPEDIECRDGADLYGAALSHLNFGRQREAGRLRVRAFNPSVDDHGWQSTHSIVEVVTDDMPFLVDSVTMEVNRHGLTLHLFIHPIVRVLRDADGVLEDVVPGADGGPAAIGRRESFMHVEVDRIADAAALAQLAADIERVLGDVRAAVEDWPKMLARLRAIAADLEKAPPPLAPAELSEGRAFIEWMADNHFTLLGYRCHDLVEADGAPGLRIVPGSGLGILREHGDATMSQSFQALPPEVRARAQVAELLVVTKGYSRSTVHRPGYLDYVGVKRLDAEGRVIGEHRFVGLYASSAYSSAPATIPLLRTKVANVVARAGVSPGSHAGKALLNILDTYPRDELFQIGEEELLATATGVLHLGDRQRFRLFVRRDPFQRFVSCLLYAPREHYNTELRRRWQGLLLDAFQGTAADFNVYLTESVLARILITVRTVPGRIPEVDLAVLEANLAAAARRWEDDLAAALVGEEGEAKGNRLFRTFGNGFPAGYREDVAPRVAVRDVRMLARVAADGALGLNLHRPLEAAPGTLRLRLYHRGGPVPLSGSLPMLERMGLRVLDERPYRVQPAEGEPVWIHDFGLVTGSKGDVDLDALQGNFEDALARVFAGTVENDDFNRLVLAAGLSAEDVVVLRAYARCLRQTGFPLSQSFIEQTLAAHGAIAAALVRLFRMRFDPAVGEEVDHAEARHFAAIEASLDAVENLSEDRVLRQLLALVLATTRTNFWCTDAAGSRRSFLSFKFDPSKIPGLPEPRPMFEIFVYSTRFEGVHLRGGKVARGGLRWSDRPEDFRTEVLGLVKAQMVKNAVIVPVGSKGGFVLKKAPPAADREAFLAEGIACYQDYLRGLLDLTDNLVGGKVVPPPRVRRHDGDDPYLVVAADKGTASFSDHANAISKEYDFWLGDAFASGGSAGYDHKAMGITARGAWESAKRHFRELGVDIQSADFTVVGVGDMSGDVFGNGMLLSKHIRLVAAFDHRHVFIDPAPDPAASWVERERLFRLPRSSWADYDASLISKGGGVWPRTAKSIPLSPEAQAALGVQAEALTPAELVSAILKAPVDLLYNGGIGTYVKSARESHASVGDRANDAVRIDGRELRCKAVVEGGNLGCTQLGRIEYALAGGRINTDAIDNSAGVDTSDHEVNLKILLGQAIADGELTERQRNKLLADMTGDVAKLVLRDNYFQTQSLSVSGRLGHALLEQQARFIRFLEKSGRLNRAIEFLPDDEEIAQRDAAGAGLVSPERAVLLAYAKIWVYDELLASGLPDDRWVATALGRYFPEPARTQFAAHAARHPLRREIISTHVVNSMVNRVGSTFVHRLMETTGAAPAEVVRAYLLTREVFDFVALWQAIEALDNKVPDALQSEMLIETGRTIVRGTAWFLRSRRLGDDMGATIARFRPGVEQVGAVFGSLLEPAARAPIEAQAGGYAAAGVPEAVAVRVSAYDTLFGALDITEVAEAAGRPVSAVAGVYFALAARLGLGWLRGRIAALPADTHWRMLAKGALRDELAELQRAIAGHALAAAGGADAPAAIIDAWAARNRAALNRTERMLAELRALPSLDLAMLSVALRELRGLG